MDKIKIGKMGEDLAELTLIEKGYQILKRNFKCKAGEIDIIARIGRTLCFIEVKTRSSDEYGMGREAVDFNKQRHIKNAANCFLMLTSIPYNEIDFQVIEVTIDHITDLSF